MRVEPARVEWLIALSEGDQIFTERYAIPVVPGWIGFPEALPPSLAAAQRQDADPWGPHLFLDDELGLVGFGGFKGAPQDHHVEIGYAIAPAIQGKGLATEAVELMVDKAKSAGVLVVVAHTLPEENASVSVLRKTGFELVGAGPDPDGVVNGEVWRWELELG